MKSREPVTARLLARSALLCGPGVQAAIAAVGSPKMRDLARTGWLVPIDRLADVLAHLEHIQHRRVEMFDTTAPTLISRKAVTG